MPDSAPRWDPSSHMQPRARTEKALAEACPRRWGQKRGRQLKGARGMRRIKIARNAPLTGGHARVDALATASANSIQAL